MRDVRDRASGSSFYTAMRILPPVRREAMFAVYDFCREVDDIADNFLIDSTTRLAELARCRVDIETVYNGSVAKRFSTLAVPVRRFDLPLKDFHAVIDGMEMDVRGFEGIPDFATLDLYCEHAASAVGRLSTRIFGIEGGKGDKLAHHLGRALQLTNILRDVDEDATMGRMYIPVEALEFAGITSRDSALMLSDPLFDQACRYLVGPAREHYRRANEIMATLPADQVRAPRVMRAVYGTILDRLEARGWASPRRPIVLGKATLLWKVLWQGLLYRAK